MLLDMLVVRGDGVAILLAPLLALHLRELLGQCALERRGEIETGVARGGKQVAANTHVCCTFWGGMVGTRHDISYGPVVCIISWLKMRINYAHTNANRACLHRGIACRSPSRRAAAFDIWKQRILKDRFTEAGRHVLIGGAGGGVRRTLEKKATVSDPYHAHLACIRDGTSKLRTVHTREPHNR